MFSIFIISLLGLCAAAIATFIAAFRKHSYLLVVFVPLIAICGSLAYFSYISVLGYPVRMGWNDLPKQITIIYFHVVNKETITLWLFEKDTTRLIELPYIESAEDGLEAERQKMGQGVPVTFKTKSKAKKGEKGENDSEEEGTEGEGNGIKGNKHGKKGGRGGWQYRVESYGQFIPGGSLPPKQG